MITRTLSVAAVVAALQAQPKRIVTFVGYAAAGYQDEAAMLASAAAALDTLDPRQTIVNIGATQAGIGAVYEIARQKGFETAGIVSTQARDTGASLAPGVDTVFFVEDAAWGGLLPGTNELSPTSAAMVAVSDEVIAIGGGHVSRDEWQAARQSGRKTRFFPAEMNHSLARERALRDGLPVPTDFRGALGADIGGTTPSLYHSGVGPGR